MAVRRREMAEFLGPAAVALFPTRRIKEASALAALLAAAVAALVVQPILQDQGRLGINGPSIINSTALAAVEALEAKIASPTRPWAAVALALEEEGVRDSEAFLVMDFQAPPILVAVEAAQVVRSETCLS